MADVNLLMPAFGIVWAEDGNIAVIDEAQWKAGWAFIGSTPPSVAQFNKVMQIQDQKSNWLYQQLMATQVSSQGSPAMQLEIAAPALSFGTGEATKLIDGTADNRYLHNPRMFRDVRGGLHVVYSDGLMHGYGGLTEANAVNPDGKIYYTKSEDNGATWTPRKFICSALPHDPENPFRTVFDCHVGVSQTGRVGIVVSDIPPPSQQWGRFTGQTKYRWFSLESWGSGAVQDRGVFFTAPDDYARIYAGSVKIVPRADGTTRLAFSHYYKHQITPALYAIGIFYWDLDSDSEPVEGAPIMWSDGANNETDFCFVTSKLGFAVARSDGSVFMTQDGGATQWVKIGAQGNFPSSMTAGFIAPTLDFVDFDGQKYLLIGWSERGTNPRLIRWAVCTVHDMLKFRDEVLAGRTYRPWGAVTQTGLPFTGSGGYSSPILFKNSTQVLYVDVTETSVGGSGYMRSDVRLTRAPIAQWFPFMQGARFGSKLSSFTDYHDNEIPVTPVLSGATSAGTPVHTAQEGFNVRTGAACFFSGRIGLSALTGIAGSLRIEGLPYEASGNGVQTLIHIVVTSPMAAGWLSTDSVVGLIINNSKYIQLYKRATNGTLTALLPADLGTTFSAYFSGTFRCRFAGYP